MRPSGNELFTPETLVRHRVLLIDDAPSIARLVEARLSDDSVVVEYAHDGPTGLEMARSLKPDLILLDVEMPGMDGFETCRRLKLDPATLQIPVVFLTGSTGTAHKILALEMGAVDYVSKPFDAAELRARVRSALRIRRLAELLHTKARVDPVTGLWNESYFDARLASETSIADRTGLPLSVVVCNVVGFRRLNAEHGIWFGDEVLCSVANVMAETARREDVLCRIEGSGLAIICPGTTLAGAETFVRRIQSTLARLRLACHGSQIEVSVAYGVAGTQLRPASAEGVASPEQRAAGLRQAALTALETARELGTNHLAIASPEQFPATTGGQPVSQEGPIRERRRTPLTAATEAAHPHEAQVNPAGSEVPLSTVRAA